MGQCLNIQWYSHVYCYDLNVFLLQVTSVRLPSDGGRAKGFGYAEFEDRQSLLEALSFSEAVSIKCFC